MSSCKEIPETNDLTHLQRELDFSAPPQKKRHFFRLGIILSLLAHGLFFLVIWTFMTFMNTSPLLESHIIPVKIVSVQEISPPDTDSDDADETPEKPSAPVMTEADDDQDEQPEQNQPVAAPVRPQPKELAPPKVAPPIIHPPRQQNVTILRAPAHPPPEHQEQEEKEGSEIGNTVVGGKALERYEQMISLWIERYKIYPPEALQHSQQGQAILRLRINHHGDIIYYRLEQSSGNRLLDSAVLSMVQQAGHVPPIPPGYTRDNQIEFLLPVNFTLE